MRDLRGVCDIIEAEGGRGGGKYYRRGTRWFVEAAVDYERRSSSDYLAPRLGASMLSVTTSAFQSTDPV